MVNKKGASCFSEIQLAPLPFKPVCHQPEEKHTAVQLFPTYSQITLYKTLNTRAKGQYHIANPVVTEIAPRPNQPGKMVESDNCLIFLCVFDNLCDKLCI
jgi:hypothetical protein